MWKSERGTPEWDISSLHAMGWGSGHMEKLLTRLRRRDRRRHLEVWVDNQARKLYLEVFYGWRLLVRDLGERKPGCYTKFLWFRLGSYFWRIVKFQEMHNFSKWTCQKCTEIVFSLGQNLRRVLQNIEDLFRLAHYGHWGPIIGLRLSDYGQWGPVIRFRLTEYGHWGLIIRFKLSDYGHWGPIIGFRLTEHVSEVQR